MKMELLSNKNEFTHVNSSVEKIEFIPSKINYILSAFMIFTLLNLIASLKFRQLCTFLFEYINLNHAKFQFSILCMVQF